jgi:hypothetical protein
VNRDDPWGARKALQPVLAIIGPLARIARSDEDVEVRERQVRAVLSEWTAETQGDTESGVRRILRADRELLTPPLDTWLRVLWRNYGDGSVEPRTFASHRGLGVWHLSAGIAEAPPDPNYRWHSVIVRCHKRNAATVREGEEQLLEQSSERPNADDVCDLCLAIADGDRRATWPKVGAR